MDSLRLVICVRPDCRQLFYLCRRCDRGQRYCSRDPIELIEKLCVLIAPPRYHLLRFHGVLAPHARLRAEVVPRSSRTAELSGGPPAQGLSAPAGRSSPSSGPGSLSWAALMKRVFELDVLLCTRCGGRRRIVAVYPAGQRLRDLLERLGLGEPPATGVP